MRPALSAKMRSVRTLPARRSALCALSPAPTPSRIRSPGPIAATCSPEQRTEAAETRCRRARIELEGAQRACGALRRDDVQVDVRGELQAGDMRQPRHDVDPPAEMLSPRRGGTDIEVQGRACAEQRAQPCKRLSQERCAAVALLILEAGCGQARDEHQLIRKARGEWRDQRCLRIERDHALLMADLLSEQIRKQVGASCAVSPGAEPLAL